MLGIIRKKGVPLFCGRLICRIVITYRCPGSTGFGTSIEVYV
ncbi:MAG: hypothetical protein ACI9AU_000230 [Bacteroidia bacterium]|jgi:hypothetical protein